ncbi:MAG: hypothetical protein GXX99_02250 [Clostridiales bacterium]|nr:hypothetical protein [Clostridiales bacterium]
MRVTNSMLVSNYMNNLNGSLGRLDRYQGQLATNRKWANVSDDPVSVIYSQQANYRLDRLRQYQGNVGQALKWATQVEGGIMELNEVIKSAYEACVGAATDIMDKRDMTNAAQYVKQLRDHILQTLNTTYGDKYVFGGYNASGHVDANRQIGPFSAQEVTDPVTGEVTGSQLCFNGIPISALEANAALPAIDQDPQLSEVYAHFQGQVIRYDVGVGLEMEVSYNPSNLVQTGGTNLYELVSGLYFEMVRDGATAEDISSHIQGLQSAQSHLLASAAEVGGRVNRLEILEARYEQDEIAYLQMKSDAEDADQAEVIMHYKMAESVYKAALSTGAYIIQPTLMDFLR